MCIYRRRIFFAGLHILAPLFPIHSVGARTLQAQRIETKLNQKPVIEVSGGVITKDAMRALSLVRGLHFSPKQNLVDLIFAALRNETVQTKGGQSGYVDRIFRMDGLPWVELMGRKAKWKVPLFQIEPPQQVVSKRLNIPREQRLDPPVVTEL